MSSQNCQKNQILGAAMNLKFISTHVQKWTSPLTGLGKFPEIERKWKLNKNTSNQKISFK
jgi:hypothetical protein